MTRKKNKIAICGKKTNIIPIPEIIPFVTKSIKIGFTFNDNKVCSVNIEILSRKFSINPDKNSPPKLNVHSKIKNIISKNIGIARYLFTNILSIFLEIAIVFATCVLLTHFAIRLSIKLYLSVAIIISQDFRGISTEIFGAILIFLFLLVRLFLFL